MMTNRMKWADLAAQISWTGQDVLDNWPYSLREFAYIKELISFRELAPWFGYETVPMPASSGSARKRAWRAANPERSRTAERQRSQVRRSGYRDESSSDVRYEMSARRNHQRTEEYYRRLDARIAAKQATLDAAMSAYREKYPETYAAVFGDAEAQSRQAA